MPTTEATKQIWKNKLNWLDEENATTLALRYRFSGGEIDNIARKATINEVITGNRTTLNEIMEYCESERLLSRNLPKLGFN